MLQAAQTDRSHLHFLGFLYEPKTTILNISLVSGVIFAENCAARLKFEATYKFQIDMVFTFKYLHTSILYSRSRNLNYIQSRSTNNGIAILQCYKEIFK